MTTIELITIIGSVASITLAIVSIWLAKSSVKESRSNYEKTAKTLSDINERAAGTEKIVGEHFDKLMESVLSIVNTATTGPEVRKAEIELKQQEQQSKIQEHLFQILSSAINSGDKDKLQTLLDTMERFKKFGKGSTS